MEIQCENCRFRADETTEWNLAPFSGECKKYSSKPGGIMQPIYDYIKDPLEGAPHFIKCPHYSADVKKQA